VINIFLGKSSVYNGSQLSLALLNPLTSIKFAESRTLKDLSLA